MALGSLKQPQVALISSSSLKFMIWVVEILLTASSNLFNSIQMAVSCSKRVLELLQSYLMTASQTDQG